MRPAAIQRRLLDSFRVKTRSFLDHKLALHFRDNCSNDVLNQGESSTGIEVENFVTLFLTLVLH